MSERIALACSLDDAALRERREEWRALDASLLGSQTRPGGMTARYRGDDRTAQALAALVEAERSCCPDIDWRIEREGDVIRLEVDAR